MSKRIVSSVNIFHYADYRQFLKDWYWAAKKSRGSFSFRTFSRKAGFKSTNILKLVMDGERNLTEESLNRFAKAFDLNKQEHEFFKNLVLFNQAQTPEAKDQYHQVLLRSRKYSQLGPIAKHQFDYYSAWYHPVVRELAVSKKCDGTPESIAREIFPAVTSQQVEKSLELLQILGFIERTSDGGWKQSHTLISTGAEVPAQVIFTYHKAILRVTHDVFEGIPAGRRDISSMTLGITKKHLTKLKKKIQEFRQEVLKLVATDSEPEEVVQLNIQLIPFTREEDVR